VCVRRVRTPASVRPANGFLGAAHRESAPAGDTASSIACDVSAVPRVAHPINSLADDINEIPHETTMFHHRDGARVKRTMFEKDHRL
jgi:hypothetical protein